jgi:hypothetical protein
MFLLMLRLLDICHRHLFTILQVHFFPFMQALGNHFRIKYVDEGHIRKYCGVEVEFDQSSRDSHHDENLIEGKIGDIGKIQEIMQVDFSSFQCVIFCCQWWHTFN